MTHARTSLPRLRVLLAHHAPLDEGAAGSDARCVDDELRQAGHRVRVLFVASAARGAAGYERRIVCNPHDADAILHFYPPAFSTTGPNRDYTPFEQLSDRQLVEYRDSLRTALDAEIDDFDPHLVHAQHAWLFGHLALEAGVPYVLSVWLDELNTLSRDNRFRRIAHEAAENAGRLIVADEATLRRAMATFTEVEPERFVVLADGAKTPLIESLQSTYQAALARRFGDSIRP